MPNSRLAQSLTLLAVASLGAAALAQENPRRVDPVQPADTASYPDAPEIARGSGLSVAEAARRLRLQEVSAPHVSRLRREFAGRLAGLYREGEGDYRLVVRLAGSAPVADRWLGRGADRMRIQFVTGAPASQDVLLRRLAARTPDIAALLPDLMGTAVDDRTGEIVLVVYAVGDDVAWIRARRPVLEAMLGNPVRLEISSSRMSDMAASGDASG